LEVGTGLMVVAREVFTKMRRGYPELEYMPLDGDFGVAVLDKAAAYQQPMFSYFESGVGVAYGEQRCFLSEDFAFCQRWHRMGGKVWMAPWVRTTHRGSFDYRGCLLDAARVQGKGEK